MKKQTLSLRSYEDISRVLGIDLPTVQYRIEKDGIDGFKEYVKSISPDNFKSHNVIINYVVFLDKMIEQGKRRRKIQKIILNVICGVILISSFIGLVTIETAYTWKLYLYYVLLIGSMIGLVKLNIEKFADFLEKHFTEK